MKKMIPAVGICSNGHHVEKEIMSELTFEVEMSDGEIVPMVAAARKVVTICRECPELNFVELFPAPPFK